MPVTILFTIPNFITAGSGRAMLNIIERLDRAKFAPAVCVAQKGGGLDKEVERLGIPFLEAPFTVPARPYRTFLARARRAAQAFKPYRFALWHSFHYADDYSEPIIARLAGARAWVYTKKNMNWHRRSWYLRTLLATRVAAQNTDMLRDFFATQWWRRKVSLVPRGVNAERFHPDAPQRLRLREQCNISARAVVAACVAHLVPVKGHPTLLEALSRASDVHLLLAGRPVDDAYAASLKKLAHELNVADRVSFLGDVRDVPALLAETDIFVLPTWAQWRMEGCPVALLEAMACGRACVATDIPGSRDLIESRRTGLLVPPADPRALAGALKELSASPELRNLLGQNARRRVLERFSIEREVLAHETFYAAALGAVERNGHRQ